MEYIAVKSPHIAEIAFEEETLFIKFKNGVICTYNNIPKTIFEELLTAEYIGEYLLENVRDLYEFSKL